MTPWCAAGGTGGRSQKGRYSEHPYPPAKRQSQRSLRPLRIPIGPRILEHANTIFEEFSVSKYVLYFVIFMIEVAAVFYIGIQLVQH